MLAEGIAPISNGVQRWSVVLVMAESCNYLNNVANATRKPLFKIKSMKAVFPCIFLSLAVWHKQWRTHTRIRTHTHTLSRISRHGSCQKGFVFLFVSLQLFAIRAAIDAGQVLASWKLKCRKRDSGRTLNMPHGTAGAKTCHTSVQLVGSGGGGMGKTISVIRQPLGRLSQPPLQFQFRLQLQLQCELHWAKSVVIIGYSPQWCTKFYQKKSG